MELPTIVDRLDERLRTDAYADLDPSANGLQVGPDTGPVEHVAFAVDAAATTMDAARDVDADLLVAHHGMVWDGLDRVTGATYDRIERLVQGELALYVAHLPLDGHQVLGNAAQLATRLALRETEPFGEMGPEYIGQRGRLTEPVALGDLTGQLADDLPTDGRGVQTLPFGPDGIEDVAIVTGSGTDWLDEAATVGADVLITGEGKQAVYHQAKEAGMNVVLAGHYATETGGVKALQSLVEDWGVETTFIDHPTGL